MVWISAKTGEQKVTAVMLLSVEEIEELTGYVRHADQIAWLQKNGLRHFVRADGRPNVPRSAVDGPKVTSSRSVPNLEALRKAG